ncbi:MAG: hypothetical protein D6706_10085 [Chloroflexi bacterium]|nr:MAG: hypothetical protein D6706_10085 [Chloroflexota bacterium]
MRQLGTNELHSWTFTVSTPDTITVSVAADLNTDVVVTLLDPSDTPLVSEQNLAPAGGVERMTGVFLPAAGDYKIRIHTTDGSPGWYGVMPLLSNSYQFVLMGTLAYGESQTASLAAENDHFWFFLGQSGESINITVTPNDNGDLFLELYDPTTTRISEFVDNGLGGEAESLIAFPLTTTGLYAIRMGEFEFLSSNYQISLSRN